MDIRDLRYFEVVADLGHLGRAAEQVHRTQPALSKSIRRLEEALGTSLFEREGRRLKLTAVGRVVLERARFLRRTMEDTIQEVGDLARGAAGHVRIGGAPTAAESLLPQVIHTLLEEAPGITVELAIAMNDALRASLRAGQLDLVVGPLANAEREFATHSIFKDEVVVAASRDHALFKAPRVRMRDLCNYSWVLPAPQVGLRAWLDRSFDRHRLPAPRVQVESGSISLMPRLIARNDLLTFISRKSLETGSVAALLREIVLPETTMRREFGVVYRRAGYLPPPVETLLRLLKTRGKTLFVAG